MCACVFALLVDVCFPCPAASGNKPSTGPPMSGEGGYGEGVVESAKQRLLVGASWLLLSEDVLQRVKLFTKSDDNSNAASKE